MRDITFGYDPASSSKTPSIASALQAYVSAVSTLPGAQRARTQKLQAYTVGPAALVSAGPLLVEALGELAKTAASG